DEAQVSLAARPRGRSPPLLAPLSTRLAGHGLALADRPRHERAPGVLRERFCELLHVGVPRHHDGEALLEPLACLDDVAVAERAVAPDDHAPETVAQHRHHGGQMDLGALGRRDITW